MSALEEKLKSEILPSSWEPLIPHQKRRAVYLIKPDQDIVKTAMYIANDDTKKIKELLVSEKLMSVTDGVIKLESFHTKMFDMLIVDPYVLIKIREES